MKKTILLKYFLCIILVFSVSLCGCDKSDDSSKSKSEKQTEQSDKSEQGIPRLEVTNDYADCTTFEEFSDTVYKEQIALSGINLHFNLTDPAAMGIEDYALILSDNSEDAIQEAKQYASNYLARLEKFDYDSLTEKEQFTYDLLKTDFEQLLLYADKEILCSSLSPTNGDNCQIPILLSEYAFYTEKDITDYIEIVKSVKDYFKNIEIKEKKRSEQGLQSSDDILNAIILQCTDFASKKEDSYLIDTFNTRIDEFIASNSSLTDEDIARINGYKEENKTAVLDYVIPAYESLAECLSTLLGTGTNETGLAGLPGGKEYYEYLAAGYSGSSKSVDELWSTTKAYITDDLRQMTRLIIADPDLVEDSENPDLFTLTEPGEILDSLQEYIKEDFPKGANTNYTVKYVNEDMQDDLSPAFYLVAPIDKYDNGLIYINENPEYDNMSLFTVLSHEGYPGHLFQTAYFYETDPCLARHILDFPGYSEGYATYVELVLLDYAGLTEDMAEVQKLNITYGYGLYSLVDIGVNYKGWTVEDTADFLLGHGITEDDVVEEIFNTVVADPGVYLSYYVGCMEILELRDAMMERDGENFSLKDFHTQLLDIGPAPFANIRKAMNLE